MDLKDLLLKYADIYDVKDHDFKLTKKYCETCENINNEFCYYSIMHSVVYNFQCVMCGFDLDFYELGITNYSRIHHNYDEDSLYFNISCAEYIIKNIIE